MPSRAMPIPRAWTACSSRRRPPPPAVAPRRGRRGRPWRLHLPGISQLELTGQHTPGASTPRLLHVRDVTHESEMERLKGEFLSTAAHELRTPIVSIYGFVELLMLRDFPPDRRQKMLATVHRQSAILIEIVNDLLDLSRIEAAGAADCELQAADPLAVVRSVVQGFRPSPVTRPGPEVIVDGPLASVHIDPGKFAQVLRNLLSNAYKYSPQGGEVRVRLGMAPGEGGTPQVRIAVEDEGIGMTPAQLARVFERFYRARRLRQHPRHRPGHEHREGHRRAAGWPGAGAQPGRCGHDGHRHAAGRERGGIQARSRPLSSMKAMTSSRPCRVLRLLITKGRTPCGVWRMRVVSARITSRLAPT